jgi:ABC-type polysaccharide/polyol phosphate export permease
LHEDAVRTFTPTDRRVSLKQLVRHWPVIRVVAIRDLKAKYKQSVLGPLWLFLQPVVLLGAFVIAFQSVISTSSSGVGYPQFVLVGVSAWSYFQAALNMGAGSLVTNEVLVRRTPVPRLAFPTASLIAQAPMLGVTLAAVLIWALLTGDTTLRILLLPIGIAWLALLTFGVVVLLAALTSRIRDVVTILPLIVQVGVFVTPIGYSLENLGGVAKALVVANPLSGVIEAWRWMALPVTEVNEVAIAVGLATTLVLVAAGWAVFVRLEARIADVI